MSRGCQVVRLGGGIDVDDELPLQELLDKFSQVARGKLPCETCPKLCGDFGERTLTVAAGEQKTLFRADFKVVASVMIARKKSIRRCSHDLNFRTHTRSHFDTQFDNDTLLRSVCSITLPRRSCQSPDRQRPPSSCSAISAACPLAGAGRIGPAAGI
mgnify:CR=1 FL=1